MSDLWMFRSFILVLVGVVQGAPAVEISTGAASRPEAAVRVKDVKRIAQYRLDLQFGTPKVRAYAAFKLGLLEDRESVPLLLRALRDRDSRVRADAAAALGELGDASVVAALTELLKDEESRVRLSAAKALSRLGSAVTMPVLLELLRDEIAEVRSYAADSLGERGDPAAHDALVYAAGHDENTNVRLAAGAALAKLLRPPTAPH